MHFMPQAAHAAATPTTRAGRWMRSGRCTVLYSAEIAGAGADEAANNAKLLAGAQGFPRAIA